MSKEVNVFDYSVISAYNELYNSKALQKKHLIADLIFIEKVKTPKKVVLLNSFFYVLKKDSERYLLHKTGVKDLPLEIKESEEVAYRGNGYTLIKKAVPYRVKRIHKYKFRHLVDKFAVFKHTDPLDFLLYKICCFAAYLSRCNFRCSSEPGFGKDSILNILDGLCGDVAIVQRPTIAKLEYLSLNKVLACNEMGNLKNEEMDEMNHYLLATGAHANKYTKRSRASRSYDTPEEYDISTLSLIIMYNDLKCYRNQEKYFDAVFDKQVRDRFMPFRFKGRIVEEFFEVSNSLKIAEQNEPLFLDFIHSIEYY